MSSNEGAFKEHAAPPHRRGVLLKNDMSGSFRQPVIEPPDLDTLIEDSQREAEQQEVPCLFIRWKQQCNRMMY